MRGLSRAVVALGTLAWLACAGPRPEPAPEPPRPLPHPLLARGALGVAHVVGKDATHVTLQLVFPEEQTRGLDPEHYGFDPARVAVRVAAPLFLFDAEGELAALPPARFRVVEWCVNDGTYPFRPEARVRLPLAALRRPLAPVHALQDLAAFVRVGPPGSARPLPRPPRGTQVALEGDADGDGVPDVRVVTAPDDAQNCDGPPHNDLTLTLQTPTTAGWLRCCGP